MLDSVRIVLSHPSHPGNIGAAARAMKTMGLENLYLIDPADYPNVEATARASGADDVLQKSTVVPNLNKAIADCHYVLGTSARLRSVALPQFDARQAAAELLLRAPKQRVALVFGREKSGLSNEEIDRCHGLVYIPTNPSYGSLNLGMAVQILCYEMRLASLAKTPTPIPSMDTEPPAEQKQFAGFMEHLESTLLRIGFLDPKQAITMMTRLRRLFLRAEPAETEINILRGVLSKVDRAHEITKSNRPKDNR